MPKKLYEVLGLDNEKSSEDEIRKAYRKKAVQYHPDKNKNDKSAEVKFKEVGAAYSILSDHDKRAQYDAGMIDEDGIPVQAQQPMPPRPQPQPRQEATPKPQPARKTAPQQDYDSNRFYPRPAPTYYRFYNSPSDAESFRPAQEQNQFFIYTTSTPLRTLFNLFTDFNAHLRREEKAETYHYHHGNSSTPEFIAIKTYHAPSMERMIDQLIAQMILLELAAQAAPLFTSNSHRAR